MKALTEIKPEYIIRMRTGDQAAFKAIFLFYEKRLYSFSFRFLKDREQAEEILQEVFLNLWINREKIDSSYPLGSFLYTVTRRLTLNYLRQAANSQKLKEKLWISIKESQNETEEAVLLADLKRQINQSVQKLPRQQQLVFRLSRDEGLSHEEIAQRLRISSNTVKNHLVQALKRIRLQ